MARHRGVGTVEEVRDRDAFGDVGAGDLNHSRTQLRPTEGRAPSEIATTSTPFEVVERRAFEVEAASVFGEDYASAQGLRATLWALARDPVGSGAVVRRSEDAALYACEVPHAGKLHGAVVFYTVTGTTVTLLGAKRV